MREPYLTEHDERPVSLWNTNSLTRITRLSSREIKTAWFCLFAVLALCLLPWFYLFGLSGMVGDSGNPLGIRAYLFLAWIWTFPLTLAIALFSRRRVPALIILPLLHVVSFVIVGLVIARLSQFSRD